jgi:hypothetical protein
MTASSSGDIFWSLLVIACILALLVMLTRGK